MHIETCGNGPDLVMVHGWAMHSGIFAPLTRLLAQNFRLHLVDLPGHGFSAERNTSLNLRDCAQRIIDATPPALWLGWSLGGLVSLQAALQSPSPAARGIGARARTGHNAKQILGLIMIASSPRFVVAPDWPHAVAHELFTQFGEGLRTDYQSTLERFLALEAHGSDHAQAELRELKAHVFERGEPALPVLEDGLRILDEIDLRAELAHLVIPSLWIAGRRDRLIPAAAMRWAAQQSPAGQYLEVSAGHAPFIAHPQTIADTIFTFANKHCSA